MAVARINSSFVTSISFHHQVTHPVYQGFAYPAHPSLEALRWDGCINILYKNHLCMCTMFMSPNMEGEYTCSILYICGDIHLWVGLSGMCWRGPHAKGLKFPWRDLEQWWCICFVWISMPIVAWYDFEMISRKSTVGARECVSFIHYDITYGKGCIAWNASVHICWSLMLWHIVAMMMIWFFLFFVHAYTSYFFRHNECVCDTQTPSSTAKQKKIQKIQNIKILLGCTILSHTLDQSWRSHDRRNI